MPTSLPRNPELESVAFARPDDHDAWRVYADWLQAEGDSRGELILLSLHERDAFLSERREVETRRKASEEQMTREWLDWAKRVDAGPVEFEFTRGLLTQVSGNLASLAPHLDALFEMAPIHKMVLRRCKPADLLALFGRQPAWVARLTYLKLEASPKLDGKSLTALASNPMPELDGINLTACAIEGSSCKALAGLQTTKLRRVVLTGNEIDDAALEVLLEADHRRQWRKLYLTSNPIADAGVLALAHDKGLAELEQLYLRQIEADFSDMRVFATPDMLPGLRVLEIEAGWNADRAVVKALKARLGKGLRI